MKILELLRLKDMPILQATFNPRGPGAVRLHMVPPRVTLLTKDAPGLIFINGNQIVPVKKGHTILLANFMEELAKFDGKPISEEDMEHIVEETIKRTQKVYFRTKKEVLADDLNALIQDFCNIAYGNGSALQYPIVTLGEYEKFMQGPHRMDLMVSPMTDEYGCWHCPNQCLHCYAAGQKHSGGKELSTEEWKQIIDKMYTAHVTQLTFTGGEPLMRKDLPELVKYARYFISRVNTNGVLLTKEYAESLAEAELDSIQVTLYSEDEDIHNKLVGANTWKKTVCGIANALDAGLSVSVNTPLCRLNYDYKKTLEFLKGLGIRYTSCSSIITTGNALNKEAEDTQLTESMLVAILSEATKFASEEEIEISFTSPGWVDADILRGMNLVVPTCGACLSNMAITPSGEVVPCQSWLSSDSLGNILEVDWKAIWNNETCKKIRLASSKMEGICPLKKEVK